MTVACCTLAGKPQDQRTAGDHSHEETYFMNDLFKVTIAYSWVPNSGRKLNPKTIFIHCTYVTLIEASIHEAAWERA